MTLGNLKVAPFICIITISVLGFITGVICIALWQENWLLKENVLNKSDDTCTSECGTWPMV